MTAYACFRYNLRVHTKKNFLPFFLLSVGLLAVLLAACAPRAGAPAGSTPLPEMTPTPTEAPMAARVNGKGILLSEFQAELQRYQAAAQQTGQIADETQASQVVLDELINQTLLAQAAAQQNFALDESAVQSRLDEITAAIGGVEKLQTWMNENFYSSESLELALERSMAAAWMCDQIITAVPLQVEQVHARQILVESQSKAEEILRQLQAGTSFENLAYQIDPLTGGELGWFPQDYLLQPEVEQAAFSLQPGSFSGIIQTSYGYHLVEVIAREADHTLSPDALLHQQRLALEKWLKDQREQASIEIY